MNGHTSARITTLQLEEADSSLIHASHFVAESHVADCQQQNTKAEDTITLVSALWKDKATKEDEKNRLLQAFAHQNSPPPQISQLP